MIDDDEDGADDPVDLYQAGLGQPNGDMDDTWNDDEAAEDELHYNPSNYCMECGEEVGPTEQLCLYCTRKAFRGGGSGLHH